LAKTVALYALLFIYTVILFYWIKRYFFNQFMNQYYFTLNISYQTFLAHYNGVASNILVVTDNGLRLQLPASRFRPFVSQIGLKGRFRLTTDQNNKFLKLELL
jgi:hypothetical protein